MCLSVGQFGGKFDYLQDKDEYHTSVHRRESLTATSRESGCMLEGNYVAMCFKGSVWLDLVVAMYLKDIVFWFELVVATCLKDIVFGLSWLWVVY